MLYKGPCVLYITGKERLSNGYDHHWYDLIVKLDT